MEFPIIDVGNYLFSGIYKTIVTEYCLLTTYKYPLVSTLIMVIKLYTI